MHDEGGRFGCETCWPSDATQAWEARAGLQRVSDLIAESHFHVMILRCPECAQDFLSVFTELVDWVDGDDPQHWELLPITSTEAQDLIGRRRVLDEADLDRLGPGRRCLQRDYPKASKPRCTWTLGLIVGPHH